MKTKQTKKVLVLPGFLLLPSGSDRGFQGPLGCTSCTLGFRVAVLGQFGQRDPDGGGDWSPHSAPHPDLEGMQREGRQGLWEPSCKPKSDQRGSHHPQNSSCTPHLGSGRGVLGRQDPGKDFRDGCPPLPRHLDHEVPRSQREGALGPLRLLALWGLGHGPVMGCVSCASPQGPACWKPPFPAACGCRAHRCYHPAFLVQGLIPWHPPQIGKECGQVKI